MNALRRLLIANRAEIAARITRACHELGVGAVAVYSDADRGALHTRLADEGYRIGPARASESYLSVERLLEALERSGADAVHPGYGFLAESPAFARAVIDAGATWVGPPPEVMELLGSKAAAKRLAQEVGIPTVPGSTEGSEDPERLRMEAERIGFPLLLKASAGGGGRGMRVVDHDGDLDAGVESARREAAASFGDGSLLVERLIQRPCHVEVQVIADDNGHVVHLGERECSIQRRHQKIVEEAPAGGLDAQSRREMTDAAVELARVAGYRGAGTVEFVVGDEGFFFLEVNARLQVEHPVTELVTGVDIVRLQLELAGGAALPFTQGDVEPRGHAIEARVYAEDPHTFAPAAGRLLALAAPEGPGIRHDSGYEAGDDVPPDYDALVAKLIVHAESRTAAVARLRGALADYVALGVTTNVPLLARIADHRAFAAGAITTSFIDEHGLTDAAAVPIAFEVVAAAAALDLAEPPPAAGAASATASDDTASTQERAGARATDPFDGGGWRLGTRTLRFVVDGEELQLVAAPAEGRSWRLRLGDRAEDVEVVRRRADRIHLRAGERQWSCVYARDGRDLLIAHGGRSHRLSIPGPLTVDAVESGGGASAGGPVSLEAPTPGTVLDVLVSEGDEVEVGQPLLVLEAMKMEQTITAPYAGIVRRLPYGASAAVSGGAVLVELDERPG